MNACPLVPGPRAVGAPGLPRPASVAAPALGLGVVLAALAIHSRAAVAGSGTAGPGTVQAPGQVEGGQGSRPPTAAAPCPWFQGSFAELAARSKSESRAVVVLVTAGESRWGPRFEAEAWSDPRTAAALGQTIPWKCDAGSADGAFLLQRVGPGRTPLTLFFDAGGNLVERADGYLAADAFIALLERVSRGQGTLPDLARRSATLPEDLELRAALVEKLVSLGDAAGAERERAELRRRDRARRTLPLRRELYAERLARIEEHFQSTREINPGPLVRFLEEERHPELLFEGYLMLAGLHRRRAQELESAQQLIVAKSKRADLRRALAGAADHLPESPSVRVEFALETIGAFGEWADELQDADRALMSRLAATAVLLSPQDARAHAALATSAFVSGDKPAAAAALRRALELEPLHPEWHSLAKALGL